MKFALRHVATGGWIAKADEWAGAAWTLTRDKDRAHRFTHREQANAVRADLDTRPPSYEIVAVDLEEWEADRDDHAHVSNR